MGQNVKDEFGVADNGLYLGNLAKDGHIYVSIDNRELLYRKEGHGVNQYIEK
jgi:hypothetical protein